MEIFYAVCAGLFVVLCGVVAVYLIQTLIQVRATARAVQILAENANAEVGKFQAVSRAAVSAAGFLSGSMGSMVSLGIQLIGALMRRRGRSAAKGEEPEPEGKKEKAGV